MRKIITILTLISAVVLVGCGADDAPIVGASDDAVVEIEMDVPNIAGAGSITQKSDGDTTDDQEMSVIDTDNADYYVENDICGITYDIPYNWKRKEVSKAAMHCIGYVPMCEDGHDKYYVEVSSYRCDDMLLGTRPVQIMDMIAYDLVDDEGVSDYSYTKDKQNGVDVSKIEIIYSIEDELVYAMMYMEAVDRDSIVAVQYTIDGGYDDVFTNEIERLISSIDTSKAKLQKLSVDSDIPNDTNSSGSESMKAFTPSAEEYISLADAGHNYYRGLSEMQAIQADVVAKEIADSILSNPGYTTDLQRVNAAAQSVAGYINKEVYGMDDMRYYRSPYGVFIAGVYTCAGTTRALGRVLDYMGYSWQHANENQNRHQWCILTLDGQTGFADGMSGIAGYGVLTNGMTLPDGSQLFFAE